MKLFLVLFIFALVIFFVPQEVHAQAAQIEVGRGNTDQTRSIFQMVLQFLKTASENINILNPGLAVIWSLLIVGTIAVACYMIVIVTLAMCSATCLACVGILLMFGRVRWKSDIAIRYYKAVAATGLKLFALAPLMVIAVNLLNRFFSTPNLQIGQCWVAFIMLCIIALLADQIPLLIGRLVSSNKSEGYSSQ